jgi:hypothetical protein
LVSIFNNLIDKEIPSILIKANELDDSSLSSNFSSILKLDNSCSLEDLFTFLNTSSKDKFAAILIDAINEQTRRGLLDTHLDSLIKSLNSYPNIKLIISLREGYEDVISNPTWSNFETLPHRGFFNEIEKAVTYFFDIYKIPIPRRPLLNSEFANPLYLNLYCKTFQRGDLNKKKTGSETFTFLLEKYMKDTVWSKICERHSIRRSEDDGCKFIWNGIAKPLAERMVKSRSREVSIRFFNSLVKSLNLPNQLRSDKILTELIDLEVLSISYKNFNRKNIYIEFAYENLSSHLLARFVLNKYFKKDKKKLLFKRLSDRCIKEFGSSFAEAMATKLADSGYGEIFRYTNLPDEELVAVFFRSLVTRENSDRAYSRILNNPKKFLQMMIWTLKSENLDRFKSSIVNSPFHELTF